MREEQIRNTIDFARLLGFQSIRARFPIAGEDGELEVPGDRSEFRQYFLFENDAFGEECERTGESGESEAANERTDANGEGEPADAPKRADARRTREAQKPQDRSAFVRSAAPSDYTELFFERRPSGLEHLFGIGRILPDKDHDFLPDALELKFLLPDAPSESILVAACNLAFRLGMDTTEYEGSMLADENYEGNLLIFEEAPSCSLSIRHEGEPAPDEPLHILLRGSGKALEEFSAAICNHICSAKEAGSLSEGLRELQALLAQKTAIGQLAYAIGQGFTEHPLFLETLKADADLVRLSRAYPRLTLRSHREKRLKHSEEFSLPWEADELRAILRELLNDLAAGDVVSADIAVSENKRIREKLRKELVQAIESKGATAEVRVLCTYKKGFSWIEETILPRLLEKKNDITGIEIAFKDFLPPGVTEFVEEDGAIPTYGADRSKLGKWLDLPIRPLQELYPAADILCKGLALDKERIGIVKLPRDANADYRIRAFSNEEILLEEMLCMDVSERNYLDEYPQMGTVHPPTGFIRATIEGAGGSRLFEKRIPSDVEAIWEIFQTRILPYLKQYILDKYDHRLSAKDQPYFGELRLKIAASEPDERLNNREDMISSLDALHEDIYFTAIEYLKCVGLENAGVLVDAPGLIHPQITEREGAPTIAFELWDFESDKPFVESGAKRVVIPQTQASCVLTELLWEDGRLVPVIRIEGVEQTLLSAYEHLVKNRIVQPPFAQERILLRSESRDFILCRAKDEPRESLGIDEIDLFTERLIGYDDHLSIINELKKVKALRISHIASSFEGRKIYAIEPKESFDGYISRTKKLSLYPSILINARHHANEVSSTNAALELIRELLTDPKYEGFSEKISLGIIPMENVDGAAIHYELQKQNPNWILHTARFNAIGREFSRDFFDPDTLSTEALAQTRMWERLLPDIHVDNHGVPSHEWAQPFSGYTAPAYKGFWLPRSILYGYFWRACEHYPQNIPLNKRLEEVIARSIESDEEISALNKEWIGQFEAYAHRWMPKQYPADYYRNMINYRIDFPYQPEHKYFSIRFPWITTVGYTSEVADETAQGKYLGLCARAHRLHDTATIELLMRSVSSYHQHYETSGEEYAVLRRERPLFAPEPVEPL